MSSVSFEPPAVRKSLAKAVLAGILSFTMLGACDNTLPLFSSIQLETKSATSNSPFYKSSVGEVVTFKNAVWARRTTFVKSADGLTGWETVSILPGPGTTYFCGGLAASASTLYAAIPGSGLFAYDGSTWTNPLTGAKIESVYVANENAFVVSHDEKGTPADSSDDAWSLTDLSGTPITLTGLLPGNAILGAVWDGINYWILTQNGLWKNGTPAGTFGADSDSGSPSGPALSLTAIAVGAAGRLYVGDSSGNVHGHSGSTWEAAVSVSTAPVRALIELSNSFLVAGLGITAAVSTGGYLELGLAGTTGAKPTIPASTGTVLANALLTNYNTTLSGKPINGLFLLTVGAKTYLFAAVTGGTTSGSSGLYYDVLTGSTWSGWKAE